MAPERKRPTRSQHYQHLLVEKSFSHEMLETFPNDESLYRKLNPFDYNEEILVLQDQLKERFWEIINEHLTKRQLEIVNLLKEGKTQQEVATKLSVNQSSITKCLSGNNIINFVDGTNANVIEIAKSWKLNSTFKNKKLYCVNEDTYEITETSIVDFIYGTEKEMIKIITVSGNTVTASADHRFFTNKGWRRLEDIINQGLLLAVSNDESTEIKFEDIEQFKVVGKELSYDIEVEGPWHNFLADGIITHNSLNGNVDYGKNSGKASYGGIVKKITKIADNDPIIKQIQQKINDIRNNSLV